MMKALFHTILFIALILSAAETFAAQYTPIGAWKQVDDTTGKPRSIIQITEHQGELQAIVKQILNRTAEDIARDGKHAICTACSGSRKNQPIEGMIIMWGVKQDGDIWDGGKILDPSSGTTYKVKLTPSKDGNKLKVRGYIGFSLLGRTQIWQRQS